GGIAVAGEPGMVDAVANPRVVTFSVRNVFEDGGNGIPLRSLRNPDARRESGAIGHGDPDMLLKGDGERKIVPDLHERISSVIFRRLAAGDRSASCPAIRNGNWLRH